MLLSDNFFMNAKILESTQFYKFEIHKNIVTQKNLPLQAYATSTVYIEKFYRKTRFTCIGLIEPLHATLSR